MINLINKRKALELAKKRKIKIIVEWGRVGSFYTVIARNVDEGDYKALSEEIEKEKNRIKRKRKRLRERKNKILEYFSL